MNWTIDTVSTLNVFKGKVKHDSNVIEHNFDRSTQQRVNRQRTKIVE
jgi:hypothetical protein